MAEMESKINLFNIDNVICVHRNRELVTDQLVVPTVKFGGDTIMV